MKKHILIPLAVVFLSVISCAKPDEGGKDNSRPSIPLQEQIIIPSTVDVTPVVPTEGGDTRITFTATKAWKASAINSRTDSWIDVNPKSGEAGPAEITISATPNSTYVERNAIIQIFCGFQTQSIFLTQKQLDNITVTTDKVELSSVGGTFAVELMSNIDFICEIEGDWIKPVPTKLYSDKTLIFSAERNKGIQKREGSVIIKRGEKSTTVKVYQGGGEPTMIISRNEYNLEAKGGQIVVEISNNVSVSMSIPGSVNWITENRTKSISSSTFYLDVAANETSEDRSAEITFSNEDSCLSEKVTVSQKRKIVTSFPEAVDLGLSVKWASFNLGAANPEECGGYYQWAGTKDVTETDFNLHYSNCPYHTGEDSMTGWTKYIPSDELSWWSGTGSPDNKTVLDPKDDVAHAKLGGKWRIPTDMEWKELIDSCAWTWTTQNGKYGVEVTSKRSEYTDKSIFLPVAGYRFSDGLYDAGSDGCYWSSSLNTTNPGYADYLYFDSERICTSNRSRCYGLSVRPVSE